MSGAPTPEQRQGWLRELRVNGFVILRGFVDVAWVVALREQLVPILNGEFERYRKGEAQTQRATNRLALDLSRYAKLLDGPLGDPRYRQHPVIEELVGEVFGGADRWRRGWSQVECVWPGSVHMDWHSDQTPEESPDPDRMNEPVRLTYNVPLVEFSWASGAMEILPGTHHLPRNLLRTALKDVRNLYPVRLDLSLGDAVLRDGNGMHRGTPNLSDAPRPMLDQTYKRVAG